MSETITIVGNVAAAPERREIGNGAEVTKFRVGCTQRRFDAQQEKWVDGHTNWFSVNAFRALGAHAFASIHKGERVIVTGRLRIRTWENDAGRGTAVEIDADGIGHDLLWGTSVFQVASRPGPGVPSAPPAGAEPAAVTTGPGDWGAPAGGPDPWVSQQATGGGDALPRETVPAGAGDAETPF